VKVFLHEVKIMRVIEFMRIYDLANDRAKFE